VIKLLAGIVAAALAVGALLSGCGGGSDGTSTATKGQFIKEASKICERAEGERNAVVKSASKDLSGANAQFTTAQLEELLTEAVPIYRKVADELEELDAPEGDEAQVEKIARELNKGFDEAEKDPKGAVTGSSAAFKGYDEAVSEYGLTKCLL
jgi:aspartokinase